MYKLVLLFFLFSFLSCNSNEPDHLIVGNWLWTGSGGGIGGMLIKPKANERIVLQFKRRGSFNVYQNDTLRLSGDYQLGTTRSIHSGKDETAIQMSNIVNHQPQASGFTRSIIIFGENVIRQLDRSKLETSSNMYDGFGSGFERIK